MPVGSSREKVPGRGGELGRMVPMVLCPAEGGSPSGLAKEQGSRRSGKVFLATQREEDLWWAADPRIRASSEVLCPISRCQVELRKHLPGAAGTSMSSIDLASCNFQYGPAPDPAPDIEPFLNVLLRLNGFTVLE